MMLPYFCQKFLKKMPETHNISQGKPWFPAGFLLFFSPPKLENIGEILISTRYKTRSPFSALGGVGDHFRSPVDLCKNCRTCPALVCRMCLLLEIAVFNNFNIYFKEHITAFCEYVYVYIYIYVCVYYTYDKI